MRILAATWTYPPARFIGSELMTHRLLQALQSAGHDVLVLVKEGELDYSWEYEGIPVQHRNAPRPRADLVICHVDLANKAWFIARRDQAKLVGICHNTGPGLRHNLTRIPFDSIIVNSESMKAELGVEGAVVVNPPMRHDREPHHEQGRPILADRTAAA